MAVNEHGEPISTGIDYSHVRSVNKLRHAVETALAELEGIDLKCLNHAGQYKAIEKIKGAIKALEEAYLKGLSESMSEEEIRAALDFGKTAEQHLPY